MWMKIMLVIAAGVMSGYAQAPPVQPTQIGTHRLGESLLEWYEADPLTSRLPKLQPTDIAPHQVGETFEAWLTLSQLDSTFNACLAAQRKHPRRKEKDTDPDCNLLLDIRNNGWGEFTTTDKNGRKLGWRFKSGKVAEYNLKQGIWNGPWQSGSPESLMANNICRATVVTRFFYYSDSAEMEKFAAGDSPAMVKCFEETSKILHGLTGDVVVDKEDSGLGEHQFREYEWRFYGRKLVKVTIKIPGDILSPAEPDTAQEIRFLTEAYGSPTKTDTYQNGYGDKCDCFQATWNRQDGLIQAEEMMRNTDRGPRHGLLITFLSKSPENNKPSAVNPYKH